jgi:hypothetical protein
MGMINQIMQMVQQMPLPQARPVLAGLDVLAAGLVIPSFCFWW